MPKIVLVANTDWYLYNFRLALASKIKGSGVDLLLVSPHGSYVEKFQELGFRWCKLDISRRGWNPLRELSALLKFIRLYRLEQPDLVHHFTIKPVLYGSFAARMLKKIAVVNAITGLGYLFVNPGKFPAFLRMAIKPLYHFALSVPHSKVVFQNGRDQELFIKENLVTRDQTLIIPGSGVDPNKFRYGPEPSGEIMILMASRMLWDKGVGELVEASKILKQRGFHGNVVLAGASDPGYPAAIPEVQLESWFEEGIVQWLGHRDDISELMSLAHIIVLPSYGEGLPKVLLEAGAAGKPVVATDVPGCRDIIRQGFNGLLVPPRDPVALADALSRLIQDPQLRLQMGAAGRKWVLEHFTDEKVNDSTIELYKTLGVFLQDDN